MSIEALKQALERIADPRNTHFAGDAQIVAREALAIAEAEKQEPVADVVMALKPPKASPAWLPFKTVFASPKWLDSVPVGTKLYTHPQPKREWVELTEEDIEEVSGLVDWSSEHIAWNFAIKIEAKLKEKNT